MPHPKISICCITYNHELYILQALESFLKQKSLGNFEIIIYDDASTDNTFKIIQNYFKQTTLNVKLVSNSKNLGVSQNFFNALESCSGEYIAICEGDDYWTDEFKIFKQINALDSNSELIISGHECRFYNEEEKIFFDENTIGTDFDSELFDFTNLIDSWFINTASLVFKNPKIKYPNWIRKVFNADYALQLFLLSKGGKVIYFKDKMSVYRKHNNGVSNTVWGETRSLALIYLYMNLIKIVDTKFIKKVQRQIKDNLSTLKLLEINKNHPYQSISRIKILIKYFIISLIGPALYIKYLLLKKKTFSA